MASPTALLTGRRNSKPSGKTLGMGRALGEPAHSHTRHPLPSPWLLFHPLASSRPQGLLAPVTQTGRSPGAGPDPSELQVSRCICACISVDAC